MKNKLEEIKNNIEKITINSIEELELFRNKYFSKKGILAELFEEFKQAPNEVKKDLGKLLNQIKIETETKIQKATDNYSKKPNKKPTKKDKTLTIDKLLSGVRHPLTKVEKEIIKIFKKQGFTVSDGPEIESDWYNFSALNFPQNHPARDMQDTFFIDKEIALRTHTSSVQVRIMENQKPPIRSIMPGRVYRNESISSRSNCYFHQVEGLFIDKDVSFVDLKQTLFSFVKEMFGSNTNVRFRPSYFPFTEPSAEMDISCLICGGSGCNICKHSGWVEILGCGMIDENVLENCKINPKEYTGFAFGMGVERITMLKYNVKDLRVFFQNDIRFLGQFIGE